MNLKEKIEEIVKAINNTIKVNQRFELKDLFPGCEWKKSPKATDLNWENILKTKLKKATCLM